MSADKRSVATDALATLGFNNIPEDSGRDAIHLAVEPCIATETLYAGQHVGFVDGKVSAKAEKKIGIVDPFVNGPIIIGARFWLVVYPRQITSLRHVWSHPDFDEESKKKVETNLFSESEAWLKNFCSTHDCPDYETVVKMLKGESIATEYNDDLSYRDEGEYIIFYGTDAHCEIPDEFWNHVENVLGRKISSRATYFSCSC